MAKKIEIDIEVNSQSVVDAKDNVNGLNQSIKDTETTTKDFGKNIKIEYDKAGNATDVLVDKSLTLTKQQRAVKAQMEILTATGKAQSKEFAILQRKYNDLGDSLSQNKARSQELFGTLSMLPGPVGQFAASLQGGLDLLKTFSGIKLTDLKTQFKAVGDDLKEIFKGFSEFNKTPIQTPGGGGATTSGVNIPAVGSSPAAAAAPNVIRNMAMHGDAVDVLAKQYGALDATMKKGAATFTFANGTTKTLTKSETDLAVASVLAGKGIKGQTDATNGLVKAEGAAITATTLLKAALMALGIGVIIAAVVALVNGLSELIFRTKESTKAFNDFNEGLKLSKEALDRELITFQNWTQGRVNALKTANAEAKLIREEEISGVKKQRESIEREVKGMDATVQDALDTYMKYAGGLVNNLFYKDEYAKAKENYQKALDQQKELTAKSVAINQEIQNKDADNQLQTRKERDDKRLRDLDILIKQETEKRDTDKKKLEDYLKEKARLEAYWGHYTSKQKEDIAKEDAKKVTAALIEDTVRVIDAEIDKNNRRMVRLGEGNDEYYELLRTNAQLVLDKEIAQADLDEKTKANAISNARSKYAQTIFDVDTKILQSKLNNSQIALNAELQSSVDYFTNLRKVEEDNYNLQIQLAQGNYDKQLLLKKEYEKKLTEIDIQQLQGQASFLQQSAELENQNYTEAEGRFMKSFGVIKQMYDRKYEDLRSAEDLTYAAELKAAGDNNAAIEQATQKHNQVMLDLAVAEKEERQQVLNMMLDAAGNFGQDLATIGTVLINEKQGRDKKAFDAGKKMAVAGIAVEKAAAIGQIWSNNAVANAKAVAAFPLTFGQPWVTINTVTAALSTAATIATAAQAISQINGTDFQPAKAGGSGKNYADGGMIEGPRHSSPEGGVPIMAEGGEAIMTRGSVTMFRPLLSMMNQMGGGTSFSKGAVGQASFDNPQTQNVAMEQPIIKTYVVENELTTIQHRAARLKDLSTL